MEGGIRSQDNEENAMKIRSTTDRKFDLSCLQQRMNSLEMQSL